MWVNFIYPQAFSNSKWTSEMSDGMMTSVDVCTPWMSPWGCDKSDMHQSIGGQHTAITGSNMESVFVCSS